MSSSGLSLPQLTNTAADFSTLTGNISDSSQMATAFQNYVVFSMGNASYQMSDSQAATFAKVLFNTGTGSTLTWPSTSDGKGNGEQFVNNAFGNDVILSSQTGGTTATIYSGCSSEVLVFPGASISVMGNEYARQANRIYNGVTSLAVDHTFVADDCGRLIVNTSAAGVSYTINAAITNMPPNGKIMVFQRAAGAITFVAGVGVTLYGPATTSQNIIYTLCRDGSTDDWYIG